MTFALRWSWVLGIALFLPAALPAGGGERYQPEICRLESSSPVFAGECCDLQASPSESAPSLRTLVVGTPLRVVRSWKSSNGEEWLQVQISNNPIIDLFPLARRGWVNV